MKKIIVAVLMAALLVSLLAGCGDKAPEATNGNDPANTTANTQTTAATEKPTEPAPVDEVTEDDFETKSVDNDTCEITACLAKATVINVPETIHGRKVVGIGQYSFNGSSAIKIILPDSVEYIGNGAFFNCEGLTEIELGTSLKRIGESAFGLCNSLKKVAFPEGLEEITSLCFGPCEALEEVYVPASVTIIPNGIAGLCPNLVIITPAGSTAEAVAQEFGIPVRNP